MPIPNRMPVLNGPYSDPGDTTFAGPSVGTSFGADAEIARRQRQLALQGFEIAARNQSRALEPDWMGQQRANIAAHGTIEQPDMYKRRMGGVLAADELDPSNPIGALHGREHAEALEKANLAPGGPESTRIAGENQLAAGRLKGEIERDVADTEAGSREYAAEVEAEQRRQANVFDNLFGSFVTPEMARDPRKRDQALAAVLDAIRRMGFAAEAQR